MRKAPTTLTCWRSWYPAQSFPIPHRPMQLGCAHLFCMPSGFLYIRYMVLTWRPLYNESCRRGYSRSFLKPSDACIPSSGFAPHMETMNKLVQ